MNIAGYEILDDSEYSEELVSDYSIILIMDKFGLCPSRKEVKAFEAQNFTERDLMRYIRCELLDRKQNL